MPKYPRVEDDDFDWTPYVSVSERRNKAVRETANLGRDAAPVILKGNRIASTFWGKAWCENLERYSDYANRLPRGRSYVRSGAVIDLKIATGNVQARVSGSRVYRTVVEVARIAKKQWKTICEDVAGQIDSLVELLEGRFSQSTMERLCKQNTGLFPSPREIRFTCSCPDSARMCKHVAAVLYGIGARLDDAPQLLFTLRDADQKDLVASGGAGLTKSTSARILKSDNLSELFGIEIVQPKAKRRR
jgi:uncharacterized Zn finger protein